MSRADSFVNSVNLVTDRAPGVDRWLEAALIEPRAPPASRRRQSMSGGMLDGNLWSAYVPFDEQGEPVMSERYWIGPVAGVDEDEEPADHGSPRYPLSVVAMSGTLPQTEARDLGPRGSVVDYLLPFADAYGSSRLFVPRATAEEDVALLCGRTRAGPVRSLAGRTR